MVSKPTGPRPPQQSRGKRRAPQSAERAPDVVDRTHEPQAGPSHHDRPTDGGASRAASGGASSMATPGERTRGAAAAAAHSHTMPPGLSLSGHVPAPSKSGKGGAVKGGASGRTVRHPQTLPGHASRVPPSLPSHSQSQEELRQGAAAAAPSRVSGSTSRPAPHRGSAQGAVGGGPIRASSSSNMMSNSVRVEVHKEQLHMHRRDPKDRHSRQAHTLPSHVAAAAGGSSGPDRDAIVSSASSSKPGKHPKERYIRQAQHKQQTTTLPPGGASGSGGPRTVHAHVHVPAYKHSTTNRPAPPPPTTTSTVSSPTNSGLTATSSHAQSHRTSRDPTEVRRQDQPSASVSVVPVQSGREHDIARITVDARAIVTRQTGASGDSNLGINLHHRVVSGAAAAEAGPSSATIGPSTTKEKCAPLPSHPPVYSLPHSHNTTRRGAAPAPPSTAAGNGPSRETPLRTVDPSSLRVDVIDPNPAPESLGAASDHVLMTNRLSTGISYGRPERLETTEALPDILNSHILPPYTVRQNQHRPSRQHQHRSAGSGAGGTGNGGGGGRSRRRSRRSGSGMTQLDDDEKGCCSHEGCLRCVTVLTTFRWVLASLALLGVLCVITGIVLGALHMTVGSSFLTLSLMFIGLGLMLVVVVGVGWKCTPQGHEPCHLLFNLGDHCTRDVRSTSHRRHRERNHWYGGVTYPEFRYRRPPPSYNASMQEFQQQLMIAQLQLNNDAAGVVMGPLPDGSGLPPGGSDDNYSLPSSPPPSYKSRASTIRPGLHITFPPQGDNSQPPTYRSRGGGTTRPSLHHLAGCGVDNPACSDAEGPWSSETEGSASSSATESAPTSNRTSPARSVPDSAMSTMHRADQVVGYLDDVLQRHDRTLEHVTSSTEGARGCTDQGTGAGVQPGTRALTVPRTGAGEGATAKTGTAPRLGTGEGVGAGAGARAGAAPRTGTGTGAGAVAGGRAVAGAREMTSKTPLEGGLTPGVSLNSVRTSTSLEETDRIQDTQL